MLFLLIPLSPPVSSHRIALGHVECRTTLTNNYERYHQIDMFVIKQRNQRKEWNSISLYDENFSFRGEAKFSILKEAKAYLKLYIDRLAKATKGKSQRLNFKYQIVELVIIHRTEPTIKSKQHMCMNKGYDYPEVYELLEAGD